MLDRERYWDCLDQAMEASSNGQPDEALAWLNEALKANPEGAEAHNSRGELFWDGGRHEEALQEFERALEAEADERPRGKFAEFGLGQRGVHPGRESFNWR